MRFRGSVKTCAQVTLVLLNLWVLAVILVVALGKWRVFDADLSLYKPYDDSHLVVMRELKEEEGVLKKGTVGPNKSKGAVAAPAVNPAGEVKKPLQPQPQQKPQQQQQQQQQEKKSPEQTDMANRVTTLNKFCKSLHPDQVEVTSLPAQRLTQILVDPKNKLLFCQIPGVAQNDWRRMFIYLTGKVNVTSHLKISAYDAHSKYGQYLKKLSEYSTAERAKIVKEYFKVVFVREPLERLVSTYQNKFQAKYSKYFHETFGKKIIAQYRKNASAMSKKTGNDVRFSEFVRFVLEDDSKTVDGALNEHWERYYRQCLPCVFNYDVVGKFETLAHDTKEVLTRAGVLNKLTPPYVADTFRNTDKALKAFYQEVPQADLKRLWRMYYPDYNLFSYPYPEVLHQLLKKGYHDY